jgi:hypothetical protein
LTFQTFIGIFLRNFRLEAFVEKIQQDEAFVKRWMAVEQEYMNRTRKPRKELIALEISDGDQLRLFA